MGIKRVVIILILRLLKAMNIHCNTMFGKRNSKHV